MNPKDSELQTQKTSSGNRLGGTLCAGLVGLTLPFGSLSAAHASMQELKAHTLPGGETVAESVLDAAVLEGDHFKNPETKVERVLENVRTALQKSAHTPDQFDRLVQKELKGEGLIHENDPDPEKVSQFKWMIRESLEIGYARGVSNAYAVLPKTLLSKEVKADVEAYAKELGSARESMAETFGEGKVSNQELGKAVRDYILKAYPEKDPQNQAHLARWFKRDLAEAFAKGGRAIEDLDSIFDGS